MSDRREVLGRLAPIYVVIEGGPGTEHEAEIAQSQGAVLIPVSRTGGCSEEIYPRLQAPRSDLRGAWKVLVRDHA